MQHNQLGALFLALCVTAPQVSAVQLPHLHHVSGDAAGDWFGYAVAPAGDVDLDGTPDFMVGAHQNLNGGHSPNPGYARVFSGVDGHVIHTFSGDGTAWIDGPDDHFGYALNPLGDLDGDGAPEIIIGAYKDDNTDHNVGMIRIFSGLTGALLHQDDGETNGDRMGASVARIADLNGDGIDEYMTGLYKDDNLLFNGGSTRVYSGADHATLYIIDGAVGNAAFGFSVSSAGDVDGDGVEDIITGAYLDDTLGTGAGRAYVHSGATGVLLHEWFGDASLDYLGQVVDGAGDVNGDGFDDLLVGAPQANFTGQFTGNGYLRVFSGADGSVLYDLLGDEPHDQLGFCARGVGDVTGDGFDDFIVGAPQAVTIGTVTTNKPGYARLYSGRDGGTVYSFVGSGSNDQFGVGVDISEDMNGDGFPEFVIGACQDVVGQTLPGYAVVISGGLLLTQRYCPGASNSAGDGAILDHAGSLSIAENDFELRVSECPPNHFGLFYYGSNAIQLPFGDGFRCVGGQTFRLDVVGTGASGSASLAVDLSSPPQPGGQVTPGSAWNFQFWYRDIPAGLSGFNLSNALTGTFAP